ncbi:MAG: hypothetical protein AB8B85_06995 [Paracoccaceae bacterium]
MLLDTNAPDIKLPARWQFILLTITSRDIHQFALKSHPDMLLTGTNNGSAITEEPVLFGAVILVAVVILTNTPTEMDDVLHMVLEPGAMTAIVWTSWTWSAGADAKAPVPAEKKMSA